LETQFPIVEKILCGAISSDNEPVMRFLIQELFESQLMPNNALLEFAVRQETSTLLRMIICQDCEVNCRDGCRFCEYDQDLDSEDLDSESPDSEDLGKEDLGIVDEHNDEQEGQYRLMTVNSETEKIRSTVRQLDAIYLAAMPNGSPGNFSFLVQRGVQVSHQYHNGNMISHILAPNHDESSLAKLQCLLKSCPDLDVLNDACLTPLALAIRSKSVRCMELLLDAGANPDVTLADNQTVLHIACCLGNKAAVESLLRCGCQTWQRNSQNLTPKEVAIHYRYYDIAAAIQKAIDSKPTLRGTYLDVSSRKQMPTSTVSSFAQTEDHGSLPHRVVHASSSLNLEPDHDTNASHSSSSLEAYALATSTTHYTTAIPSQITEMRIPSLPHAFVPNSPKRQNSNQEFSQLQAFTKRTRPS
jgi:hypothetical protein